MPHLDIDGVQLHYEVHGERGPWLVCVSGLGGHGAFWKEQIAQFSGRYRVVVHDHRGHGQSTGGDAGAGIEEVSRDVLRLFTALRIDTAVLAGHSMGGMVSMRFALDHPERLKALVISGSAAKQDDYTRMIVQFRRRVLTGLGREGYCRFQTLITAGRLFEVLPFDEILESERRSLKSLAASEVIEARLKSIEAFDVAEQLLRINAPTLVLAAEDDEQAPLRAGRLIADSIPGAKLEVVPGGSGHFFPRTNPRTYNVPVDAFLKNLAIA